MAIYLTREQTQLVVSGKTFEVKETIKTLGGKWDPARRCWTLPLELDTEETRTRLGALTKQEEEVAEAAAAERRAKAPEMAKKRRTTAAAKNLDLVKWCLADKTGKYSWVCCQQCEIVDLKKGHISCRAHAHWDGQSWCSFRVFGSVYTGN
jgi:hypothetical protein